MNSVDKILAHVKWSNEIIDKFLKNPIVAISYSLNSLVVLIGRVAASGWAVVIALSKYSIPAWGYVIAVVFGIAVFFKVTLIWSVKRFVFVLSAYVLFVNGVVGKWLLILACVVEIADWLPQAYMGILQTLMIWRYPHLRGNFHQQGGEGLNVMKNYPYDNEGNFKP